MKALVHRKRGQVTQQPDPGAGPATLVIVLVLLLTLYIMLLPPEERAELLEDDNVAGSSKYISNNLTLLDESPGRLDYHNLDEYTHTIDAFTLYKTTASNVLKQENPFTVRHGWFDNKEKQVRFSIDNPEMVTNMLLSFNAPLNKGTLQIAFNGITIFEQDLQATHATPIPIDGSLVQEENYIDIAVDGVGWAFWTTNEYQIESFKITGDVSDTSRQESRNVFVIREEEKENLDEVKLKFNPDCIPNQVGTLEITINNNRIYSGIPDCGILNTKTFSPGYIDAGENTLILKTNEGSYLIDHISVETSLKDFVYPFYYFEVNESLYEEVVDGKVEVNLELEFFDDNEYKKATIFVNGRKTHMNTYDPSWDKDITTYIDEGTNGIKIEPDDTVLDVVRLRVRAVEVDD